MQYILGRGQTVNPYAIKNIWVATSATSTLKKFPAMLDAYLYLKGYQRLIKYLGDPKIYAQLHNRTVVPAEGARHKALILHTSRDIKGLQGGGVRITGTASLTTAT